MTTAELQKFRNGLEAKQAELTGSLSKRDEIVTEKAPDTLDEVQQAGERELAFAISTATRPCCGRYARLSAASPTDLMVSAGIAKKKSLPVAFAAKEKADRREIDVDDATRLIARAA